MLSNKPYRRSFYRSGEFNADSAREILPFIFGHTDPQSAVDVGCGTGEWLRVCQELGVDDITGIDFHDASVLHIPRDRYLSHNLVEPLSIGRMFDLAVSLEVAEHLPAEKAQTFIESVTKLAPVTLFSAAVPGQSGTGHINLQWPDYWASLFFKFGFEAFDCVRPRFWENSAVTSYYAQNAVLYIHREVLHRFQRLASLPSFEMRRLIHPLMWQGATDELAVLRPLYSARGLVNRLPGALWLSFSDRIKRLVD